MTFEITSLFALLLLRAYIIQEKSQYARSKEK
jgi:hypothetical protein